MRKLCVAIVLFSISCLFGADESPGEAKNIYGVLLQAIQDGDASVFQELGTVAFKKQITPELFHSAQNEIGIRSPLISVKYLKTIGRFFCGK